MKKTRENINGWLILNKPYEMGSTKALAIAKRCFNAKKAGHAGTLDPLASGVLPIAFGEATKTINYMMDAEKEYEFKVKWGEATSTDDMEGEVIANSDKLPTEEEIKTIITYFTGAIEQTPPIYSAIKIDGKRAYDIARSGGEIEMKSRKITIHNLELIGAEKEVAHFRVFCSKGTYIRSLARDIAVKLGTCGHVVELIRTKVGKFCIKSAILLEKLENNVYKNSSLGLLMPVEEVLDDIPVLAFNSEDTLALRQGKKIPMDSSSLPENNHDNVFVVKNEGKLVAIVRFEDGLIRSSRVFNI